GEVYILMYFLPRYHLPTYDQRHSALGATKLVTEVKTCGLLPSMNNSPQHCWKLSSSRWGLQ
ncbi:hypothetical protein STEG23_013930, partial [Scotinomys teguina]